MNHQLHCQRCEATFESDVYPEGCPACLERGEAGRLEVTYDFDDVAVADLPFTGGSDETSMWRYRELLPLLADEPTTMGEGWTPVVEARELSDETGLDVRVKNETPHPTWSYKDRLNSLLVSNAVAEGETRVATASTGNHGASTAAYARRAGLTDVIVLVPHETERPLRAQIRAYGADAVVTDYEARGELLGELVARGWYPTVDVTGAYVGLPYAVEGYRTIAFELVEQLGTAPDAVAVPVGAGDGLYGIWKGFRELDELGIIDDPPKMVGVQAAERAALAKATEAGAETVGTDEGPLPITVSVGGSTTSHHALRAVRESSGTAYAIPREEVERAMRELGREGIVVEPASALAYAAVRGAAEDGVVESGDTVVPIATGAGVKWPGYLEGAVGDAPEIEPTLDALADAVSVPLD
jgi:threonine synthase